MTDSSILEWLRRFFLGLVGFMCIGTPLELLLMGHIDEPMQWVPFVLCGLGLIAVLATLRSPQRNTLQFLRITMALLIIGSLVGVYEHLAANLAFAQETRPNAELFKIIRMTITGGSPLLAPGTLALAAITAFAATYRHPVLK